MHILLLLTLAASTASAVPLTSPPSQSSTSPQPERLYVIGGSDSAGDAFAAVYRLEKHNKWVPKPYLRTPRFAHASAVYGEYVYTTGGSFLGDGNTPLNTVERFDGAKWATAPPLTTPRMGHAAVVYSSLLCVLGGNASSPTIGAPMASVECFDGLAWSAAPPMILPRADFGAAVFQNLLYAVGGSPDSPSSVEYFNGTGWDLASPTIRRRLGASVMTFDGFLYAVGGFQETTVERFDGQGWSLVSPLSTSAQSSRRLLALSVYRGSLYAAGGSEADDGFASLTSSVSTFDGEEWHKGPTLPQKNYGLSLVSYTPPTGNCSLYASCSSCVPSTGCAWTVDHGCAMPDNIKCDLQILSLDGCDRLAGVKKDTFIGVIPVVGVMLAMLVALYRDILAKGGLSAEASAQPLLHPSASTNGATSIGSGSHVKNAKEHSPDYNNNNNNNNNTCWKKFQAGMKRARPYIFSIITCYTATNSMLMSKAVDTSRMLEQEATIPLACTSSGFNIPRTWYLEFLERIPNKLVAGLVGFGLLGVSSILWDYIWSHILSAVISFKYRVPSEKDPWWKKFFSNFSFLPLQLIKVAVGTYFLPSIATHVLAFTAAPWRLATEGIHVEKSLHAFWALLGWNLVPAVALVLLNASVPFGLSSLYKALPLFNEADQVYGRADKEVSPPESPSREEGQETAAKGQNEEGADDFPSRSMRSRPSVGSLREDAADVAVPLITEDLWTETHKNVNSGDRAYGALRGTQQQHSVQRQRQQKKGLVERYVTFVIQFLIGSLTNTVYTFLSIPLPVMEPFFPTKRQLLDAAAARGSMALFIPLMIPFAGPYLFLLMSFFNLLQPFGVGVWMKDAKGDIYGRILGAMIFAVIPMLLLIPRFQAGSYLLKN